MRCRVRGLDVHCEVIGTGWPIVMVHGMGVDHRTMKGCMEPVFAGRPDAWRRVYFDLPGMGKTPSVDWIANSDDMASFVSAFIEEVVPTGPFAVVGESYGGYLVRAVVRERVADVAGLLLLCPLVVAPDDRRDVAPRAVLRRDAAPGHEEESEESRFVDLFLTNQTAQIRARFREGMLAGFESGDGDFQTRIRGGAGYEFTYDADALPTPFVRPVLILTGRQDCLTGYRDAWRLLERYPRATFVTLDMAGHGLQIEQPELFSGLVAEWLGRVERDAMEGRTEFLTCSVLGPCRALWEAACTRPGERKAAASPDGACDLATPDARCRARDAR